GWLGYRRGDSGWTFAGDAEVRGPSGAPVGVEPGAPDRLDAPGFRSTGATGTPPGSTPSTGCGPSVSAAPVPGRRRAGERNATRGAAPPPGTLPSGRDRDQLGHRRRHLHPAGGGG